MFLSAVASETSCILMLSNKANKKNMFNTFFPKKYFETAV